MGHDRLHLDGSDRGAVAGGAGCGPGSGGWSEGGGKGAAAPRTPWGDPDLQGTWSGDSAQAIPMQRPAQFAGRAELTDEEFKAKVERDTATRKRALERRRLVRG